MKNGKRLENDRIMAVLLKYAGRSICQILANNYTHFLRARRVSRKWSSTNHAQQGEQGVFSKDGFRSIDHF